MMANEKGFTLIEVLPAKVDIQVWKGEATYRFLFHLGEGVKISDRINKINLMSKSKKHPENPVNPV